MISLRKRLILTYALFISAALFILTAGLNIFAQKIFESFVKDTIKTHNREIVDAISELYNPIQQTFDRVALESIGMLFMHDGYIVDVESADTVSLWDARTMDMQHCVEVVQDISRRMKTQHGIDSELQNTSYPLTYHGITIGQVNIATVGPFFYTESEGKFLASLNRLLIIAACVFIILTVCVSILLGASIARPINAASKAARQIASFYASGSTQRTLKTTIREDYKTLELTELSKSINELSAELADSERRQKQLTSDIAHELRTPLASLQGTIEAMIDGVWAPDRVRLTNCYEEITRLSKLVEDMRVLTGLEWESITLHKTDFDIAALLERVADYCRPAANEKGIAIHLKTVSAKVYADYDRAKQVFINLVSNAVQYTDTGHITITVEFSCNIIIKIEDTGIGIAKDDLPHIFERFYRTDKSRARSTGGYGIGLSIAAAIATAHGWTISAESEMGRGTCFTITHLPRGLP
ncbi:MAG: HAMP domain-containing histidine kinase [Spirochaetaceae bacterium]|jgi:signal transduction histidine kinase|nr:HAMP domain-containing histidine kinase [Spirochaetaceae bacterium]